MFINQSPTTHQKSQTWGTPFKWINVLIETGVIKITGTLNTTFHIPAGEANLYVCFVYGPLTIYNHIRGQVSGSMNSDTINTIHTT